MIALDSDDVLLKDDDGRPCTRDIVQFVKFLECIDKGNLAEEVLKEVPDQVCLYMEQNGIKPAGHPIATNEVTVSLPVMDAQPSLASQKDDPIEAPTHTEADSFPDEGEVNAFVYKKDFLREDTEKHREGAG